MLIEVADSLQKSFRESDIVARIGGEEFFVLTSNMDAAYCSEHFEKLRAKIENLLIVAGGYTIQTSVSIGISTVLEETLDKMIQQADGLLYQAKKSGRNCIILK